MILEPRTTDTGATTDTGDWRHERPILNKLLPEQQSQATTDTGTMNDRHWSYRSHERQEIQIVESHKQTTDTGAMNDRRYRRLEILEQDPVSVACGFSICCHSIVHGSSIGRSWLQYHLQYVVVCGSTSGSCGSSICHFVL